MVAVTNIMTQISAVSSEDALSLPLRPIRVFERKQISTNKNLDDYLAEKNVVGYVSVRNDEEGKLLRSAPGVSCGGLLCVRDDTVSLIYIDHATSFVVDRTPGVDMKPTFSKLSPISYASSNLSRCLGILPRNVNYVYTPDGTMALEEFEVASKFFPKFSKGIFLAGVPIALSGVCSSSEHFLYIPKSTRASRMMLLNPYLDEASSFKLEDDLFVEIGNSAAMSQLQNFVSGNEVSGLQKWLSVYPVVSATLGSVSGVLQFVTKPIDPDYTQVLNVVSSSYADGSGIREWINSATMDFMFVHTAVSTINELAVSVEERYFNVKADSEKALKENILLQLQKLSKAVNSLNESYMEDEAKAANIDPKIPSGFSVSAVPQVELPNVSVPSINDNFTNIVNCFAPFSKVVNIDYVETAVGDGVSKLPSVNVSKDALVSAFHSGVNSILKRLEDGYKRLQSAKNLDSEVWDSIGAVKIYGGDDDAGLVYTRSRGDSWDGPFSQSSGGSETNPVYTPGILSPDVSRASNFLRYCVLIDDHDKMWRVGGVSDGAYGIKSFQVVSAETLPGNKFKFSIEATVQTALPGAILVSQNMSKLTQTRASFVEAIVRSAFNLGDSPVVVVPVGLTKEDLLLQHWPSLYYVMTAFAETGGFYKAKKGAFPNEDSYKEIPSVPFREWDSWEKLEFRLGGLKSVDNYGENAPLRTYKGNLCGDNASASDFETFFALREAPKFMAVGAEVFSVKFTLETAAVASTFDFSDGQKFLELSQAFNLALQNIASIAAEQTLGSLRELLEAADFYNSEMVVQTAEAFFRLYDARKLGISSIAATDVFVECLSSVLKAKLTAENGSTTYVVDDPERRAKLQALIAELDSVAEVVPAFASTKLASDGVYSPRALSFCWNLR